jgi:predicted nucleotide-binding protein (sugar kinase/HSP70/actin superfamily)
VLRALRSCKQKLEAIDVDRSVPKPRVSIIGEFWAMTTEGDGNYRLQSFLEQEGAEVDVQIITNWLLFMVWENRHDTVLRMDLKREDEGRKGLKGKDAQKKMMGLVAADALIRAVFQTFAAAIGLKGYHLADMHEIAKLAADHYDLQVRGGEAHMEVGKLRHFIEDKVNHLTISVKPFGCMPSSGVSDGVQAAIQGMYPEALFLPIETTGDGQVNVHSRVQMMLFKAKQAARAEYDAALQAKGLDEASFRTKLQASKRWRSPTAWPKHQGAGTAANLVGAV